METQLSDDVSKCKAIGRCAELEYSRVMNSTETATSDLAEENISEGMSRLCPVEEEDEEDGGTKALFKTVDEVKVPTKLSVEGEVPGWLSGSMVRVGPGKFEFGDEKYVHWFDGMAIVHKFEVKNQEVFYSSRFVESNTYKENTRRKRIVFSEFGTAAAPDPCLSKFGKLKARFKINLDTDNCNVSIMGRGGAVLVLSDSTVLQVLRHEDLETIGKFNWNSLVSVDISTSHPHVMEDGTMYNLGSSFRGRPTYHIIKIHPQKPGHSDPLLPSEKVEIVATIPSCYAFSPCYYHSFGMTENYFVFAEGPVTMNMAKFVTSGIFNTTLNTCFEYDPTMMVKYHVIRRDTGELVSCTYEAEGYFFWHVINTYEENESLVLDVCMLKGFSPGELFRSPINEMADKSFTESVSKYDHYPCRFVLPLNQEKISAAGEGDELLGRWTSAQAVKAGPGRVEMFPQRLLPEGQGNIDMPCINYTRFNGKKYRYFYGTGLFINAHFKNAVGKVDVLTNTSQRWIGSNSQYPSEPIFVSRPGSTEEDDGILLVSVCDTKASDFLLVLDASSFTEIARSYVEEDQDIPYSLHGTFISS